ncbi:MAG: hypothetical protein ACI8P0_004476, partial [Planctomycetaceae bacterium]
MNSPEPDSLDRDVTRTGDVRGAGDAPSSLGDLSTNSDLEGSLSDIG